MFVTITPPLVLHYSERWTDGRKDFTENELIDYKLSTEAWDNDEKEDRTNRDINSRSHLKDQRHL